MQYYFSQDQLSVPHCISCQVPIYQLCQLGEVYYTTQGIELIGGCASGLRYWCSHYLAICCAQVFKYLKYMFVGFREVI